RTLTTPAGCAFVCVNLFMESTGYVDVTDSFMMNLGEYLAPFEPYRFTLNRLKNEDLGGSFPKFVNTVKQVPKSIAFLGDSIIASTVYDIVEAIGKKIEFKNIIRKARSGARWNNTAETTYDISNTGPAYNNTIWNQLNI